MAIQDDLQAHYNMHISGKDLAILSTLVVKL